MAVLFNTNFDQTHPFSDVGAMVQLAQNTALSWTVPGTNNQTYRALFSYNESSDIWVALNKTAVVPSAGAVVDVNQQEFRPHARYVRGGDVLSFITNDSTTPQFGVSLMALPSPK